MKLVKLALYVALVCCAALFCGSAAADQCSQTSQEKVGPADQAEVKAVPRTSIEATDPEALAQDTQELGPVLETTLSEDSGESLGAAAVLLFTHDVLSPDPAAQTSTAGTGWYKICVPDICQPCSTDADCWPGNRCRAQLCP